VLQASVDSLIVLHVSYDVSSISHFFLPEALNNDEDKIPSGDTEKTILTTTDVPDAALIVALPVIVNNATHAVELFDAELAPELLILPLSDVTEEEAVTVAEELRTLATSIDITEDVTDDSPPAFLVL
jgi:hypothetical protein